VEPGKKIAIISKNEKGAYLCKKAPKKRNGVKQKREKIRRLQKRLQRPRRHENFLESSCDGLTPPAIEHGYNSYAPKPKLFSSAILL
jgi:hypothetical protein